jgi:heme/copper-type cytochrome/quinol oxidase subunit 2
MARKTRTPKNDDHEGKFCVINVTAFNRKWLGTYAEAVEHAKDMIEKHDIEGTLIVCRGLAKVTRLQPIRVEQIK